MGRPVTILAYVLTLFCLVAAGPCGRTRPLLEEGTPAPTTPNPDQPIVPAPPMPET